MVTTQLDGLDVPSRPRMTRRAAVAGSAAILLVAGSAAAWQLTDRHGATTTAAHAGRPFVAPPVEIRPVTSTGERVGTGTPVLARAGTGTAVRVAAVLSFEPGRAAAVDRAALILTRPGTTAGVGGRDIDSQYREDRTEIARGPMFGAASPNRVTLTITAPRSLPPGTYPVMYAYRAVGAPVEDGGAYDPSVSSGQLGVIVVTKRR